MDSDEELFGIDRMLSALNEDTDLSMDGLLIRMKKRIDDFVSDAPQFDDITMLYLKYYGEVGEQDG